MYNAFGLKEPTIDQMIIIFLPTMRLNFEFFYRKKGVYDRMDIKTVSLTNYL